MSDTHIIEVTDELKSRVTNRMQAVLSALVGVESVHGTSCDAIRALHAELAAARDDAVEIFGLDEAASAMRAPGDKE